MKLNFPIIAESFGEMKVQIVSKKPQVSFSELRYFSKGIELLDDYLYFVSCEKLKEYSEDILPPNIVASGDALPNINLSPDINCLFINTTDPEQVIFTKLQDIFSSYRKWHERMLNAIIVSKSTKTILDIAAEKLSNPVALFDTTASLMHWSGKFSDEISGSIWEKVLEEGTAIDFYTFQEWAELTERLNNTSKPFIYKSTSDSAHSMLICPVKSEGRLIASLGTASINEPFTNKHILLFEVIRDVLELALNNSAQLREENTTYYVESLIKGVYVEEKIISYYLKRRGWAPDGSYRLLNYPYPDGAQKNFNPYRDYVKRKFPAGLLCTHEDSLILIINTAEYDMVSSECRLALNAIFDECGLHCGISAEFYDFTALKYYYIQSKKALTEGARKNPELPYYFFTDYYKPALASALDSVTSLKALVHPKILQMVVQKDEKQQMLIQTLSAYLLNGKNLTTTSEMLHIHRNTLTYRLDKISDYLQIDFQTLDADELFYLLISCFIVENWD